MIELPSTITTGAVPLPSTATGPKALVSEAFHTALQSFLKTVSAVLAAASLKVRSPSAGMQARPRGFGATVPFAATHSVWTKYSSLAESESSRRSLRKRQPFGTVTVRPSAETAPPAATKAASSSMPTKVARWTVAPVWFLPVPEMPVRIAARYFAATPEARPVSSSVSTTPLERMRPWKYSSHGRAIATLVRSRRR